MVDLTANVGCAGCKTHPLTDKPSSDYLARTQGSQMQLQMSCNKAKYPYHLRNGCSFSRFGL
ncbi:MAG TPA: hypothetical protein VNZ48_16795 [Xanthobacteraceae bacterium]|jgi:hypothetical protein|nr:hypothetical protein [Xanthobacteraceae bacterium]